MSLALRLGRSLGELVQTMDSHEWDLWVALYGRDPWDASRDDLRAGIVAATVANYAGKVRREGAEPASPGDFMPFVERAQEDEVLLDPDPESYFSQIR